MKVLQQRSQENSSVKEKTLSPQLLHHINAYWRAANYLSVGQI
jgi:xylulose-5-phosphate/fructose-6-phosphate phosphoketolase